ncbi:hypothetical protein PC117_g19569 [Phytophthora cactorum]|uniref:Uncharacterized protein n=1 Tax=Phytophthora cactorum TaxID=29920 RepID=A0A8T1BWA1_9STRA|nr:hypothetical protein PC117_g19569 [Phytophthora cactorum]
MVASGVSLVTGHSWELAAVAVGILLWTATEPFRSMVIRLFSAVGYFVYKWAKLIKLCISRYRNYVRGPAVQNQPRRTKWWKTYEALLATPTVVLVARKEHLYGLGRLVYKCTAWFQGGAQEDLGSCLIIEGACLGWPGVVILTLTTNYQLGESEDVVDIGRVTLDRSRVVFDSCVLVLGVVGHLWRWYEAASEGRSFMTMARDCHAEGICDWKNESKRIDLARHSGVQT